MFRLTDIIYLKTTNIVTICIISWDIWRCLSIAVVTLLTVQFSVFSLFLLQSIIVVNICLLFRLGRSGSLLHVGLDVEVSKEKEEQGPMEQNDVAEYLGEVTLEEQRETSMDEESHKLS